MLWGQSRENSTEKIQKNKMPLAAPQAASLDPACLKKHGFNPELCLNPTKVVPTPNCCCPASGKGTATLEKLSWAAASLWAGIFPGIPGNEPLLTSPASRPGWTTGNPWNFRRGLFPAGILHWRRAGTLSRVLWALSKLALKYPGMGHPGFLGSQGCIINPWRSWDSLKYSGRIPWIGIKILNLLISEMQNGMKIKKCTLDYNSFGFGGARNLI